MKYRKLRIAWSVVWGVAAVLICVTWARSYSFLDFGQMHVAGGITLHVQSVNGQVKVFRLHMKHESLFGSLPIGHEPLSPMYERPVTSKVLFGGGIARGVQIDNWPSYGGFKIHYWSLSVAAVSFAALPWLRLRFTLRTLLIATTLVAIVLGVVAWSIR